MHTYEGGDLGCVYSRILHDVHAARVVRPRGKPCREFPQPVAITTWRWMQLKGSGTNYRFATAEALSYLAGWNEVAWLARYNPRIAQFSDDGVRFHGHYGERLYDQLDWAVQKLKQDPDSRQVTLNIWRHDLDMVDGVKDYPCNTQLHLKLRGGSLRMLVVRRSSDLIWGVPNDHHAFWALLTCLATALNVDAGPLVELADSLHLYLPEAGFYDQERVEQACQATSSKVTPLWLPLVDGDPIALQRMSADVVRRYVEDRLLEPTVAKPAEQALGDYLRKVPPT